MSAVVVQAEEAAEVDALAAEADMPLEQLLAMYGHVVPGASPRSPSPTPPPKPQPGAPSASASHAEGQQPAAGPASCARDAKGEQPTAVEQIDGGDEDSEDDDWAQVLAADDQVRALQTGSCELPVGMPQ